MTSIALGLFILFIVYVMIWSIRNDQNAFDLGADWPHQNARTHSA